MYDKANIIEWKIFTSFRLNAITVIALNIIISKVISEEMKYH